MLNFSNLTRKQHTAFKRILAERSCFLIADMGEGKTIITLAAIRALFHRKIIKNVVVFGPKDVITLTWPLEIQTWKETKNLPYTIVRGSPKKRAQLLEKRTGIFLINYENMVWLHDWMIKNNDKFPFDMAVFDESVKMASVSNKRFKKWKPYFRSFKKVLNLTADPIPNKLESIYGQTYLLDSGATFGHNFRRFQEQYFRQVGWSGFKWVPQYGSGEILTNKTKHLVHRLKGTNRPYKTEDVYETLSPDILKRYRQLETEMFIELDNEDVPIPSQLVGVGKCSQFVGGNIYTGSTPKSREAHIVHDTKLNLLKKIVKQFRGRRLLIAYEYAHELDRIRKTIPVRVFNEGNKEKNIEEWNTRLIQIMAIHPKSAGHGLNLQFGGSTLIWYTLPWSADLYNQTIGRLNRTGQTEKVEVYRLLIKDTIDTVKKEVLRNREKKSTAILEAFAQYKKTL
jgi:hypothetical protein